MLLTSCVIVELWLLFYRGNFHALKQKSSHYVLMKVQKEAQYLSGRVGCLVFLDSTKLWLAYLQKLDFSSSSILSGFCKSSHILIFKKNFSLLVSICYRKMTNKPVSCAYLFA